MVELPEVDTATVVGGVALYGHLTPEGWTPPSEAEGELTFEQWSVTGQMLNTLHNSVKFARGDWLLYGEGKGEWGEMYAQAVDLTQVSEKTLKNEAWVAGAVDISLRRSDLSWSHHRAVAALSDEEQEHWLAVAAEGQIGSDNLTRLIKAKEIEIAGGLSPTQVHSFFGKLVQEMLHFQNSVEDMGGIAEVAESIDPENRKAVAFELEQVVAEFGQWVEYLKGEQGE